MIYKILGVFMMFAGSVFIHLDPVNIPVGVIAMIWGWDIMFNLNTKPFKLEQPTVKKRPTEGNITVGYAGEDLDAGDCVVLGDDNLIYKAKNGDEE